MDAFSGLVDNLTAATQVYFAGYATNSAGTGYSVDYPTTFWTEPATQPTGSAPTVGDGTLTINWSAPGTNQGAIVVINTTAPAFIPTDGNRGCELHTAWQDAGATRSSTWSTGTSVRGDRVDQRHALPTGEFIDTRAQAAGESGINYLEDAPLTGSGTPTVASDRADTYRRLSPGPWWLDQLSDLPPPPRWGPRWMMMAVLPSHPMVSCGTPQGHQSRRTTRRNWEPPSAMVRPSLVWLIT